MSDSVTFRAAYPPIQSAIKIDGQGGARIQLDIPESEMGNFISAMMWRGQRLKIIIEPEVNDLTGLDDAEQADKRPKKRTTKVGRGRS